MDLPKTAPKRKEIDIYIDQKNQIEPTIKRIKNKIQERVILPISINNPYIMDRTKRNLIRKTRLICYKAESVALFG